MKPFSGYDVECLLPDQREQVVRDLMMRADTPFLVLSTCQRLECYGYGIPEDPRIRVLQTYRASDAFERIARIAAGVESRVLGELEVLGQVRTAYKLFRESANGNHNLLDRIFQDALALGRAARKASGIDRNLISLSGLATQELVDRVPHGSTIAVVGAGSLAGSIVRNLRKRGEYPVRIASRCPDRAYMLAMEVEGFSGALDNLAHLFEGVSGIITATGAPHPLVYPHHLEKTGPDLTVIDLGVPPDCAAAIREEQQLAYISLEDIEAKAQVNSEDRRHRADIAARMIRDGALAWSSKS
ncbi:MAG: hypothetical protein H7A43_08785 [Verrucomicrobia bacterium]|nr:hypothetical protein [Verrucomicrobiota bacterium]